MAFITLLSDLGTGDASVARVKSILLPKFPTQTVVDVTHELKPFLHLQQAAYFVASALQMFPAGSVHVVIYNIYYDRQPKMVLLQINNQYVLAPDNGILPLIADSNDTARICYDAANGSTLQTWINAAAHSIEKIQQENGYIDTLAVADMRQPMLPNKLQVNENEINCHVIHIDRFENVILNVTKHVFEAAAKNRRFSIEFLHDEKISTIAHQYNDVSPGDKLCRFNSAAYLEVSVNSGNGSGLLGLKPMGEGMEEMTPRQLEELMLQSKVKIKFE